MTEHIIRIGETGNHHYIGVQPPVGEAFFGDVMLSGDMQATGCSEQAASEGGSYTELGLESDDEVALRVAYGIATVLKARGEGVEVDEEIKSLNYETKLF